jgi:hypothetical protein
MGFEFLEALCICYTRVKIVGGKRLANDVENSYILKFVSVG